MPLKLVIFDLDGLMFDSERYLYNVWKELFAEKKQELPVETYAVCLGRSEEWCGEYAHSLCPALDPKGILDTTRARAEHDYLNHNVSAKKGLYELLDHLDKAGVAYCIGSSNSNKNVMASLLCMKLDPARFKTIVTGDDVAACKPAPDIFNECARRCGTPASACLVLEDSGAGMRCVVVPDLLPPSDDLLAGVFRTVESLLDVIPIVDELAEPRRGCFSRPFRSKNKIN